MRVLSDLRETEPDTSSMSTDPESANDSPGDTNKIPLSFFSKLTFNRMSKDSEVGLPTFVTTSPIALLLHHRFRAVAYPHQ